MIDRFNYKEQPTSRRLNDIVDAVNDFGVNVYTKAETDAAINNRLTSLYRYKGSVETKSDLDAKTDSAVGGDVWDVKDTDINYAFVEGDGRKYSPNLMPNGVKVNNVSYGSVPPRYVYEGDKIEFYDCDYNIDFVGYFILSQNTNGTLVFKSTDNNGDVVYLKTSYANCVSNDNVQLTNNANDACTLNTYSQSGYWDALGSSFDAGVIINKITSIENTIDTYGTAAKKDATDSVTTNGNKLPTEKAVANAISSAISNSLNARVINNNGLLILETKSAITEPVYLLREVSRRRKVGSFDGGDIVTRSKSYQAFRDVSGETASCLVSFDAFKIGVSNGHRELYSMKIGSRSLVDVIKSRIVRANGTIWSSHGSCRIKSSCVKLALATADVSGSVTRYRIFAKFKMIVKYNNDSSPTVGFST